ARVAEERVEAGRQTLVGELGAESGFGRVACAHIGTLHGVDAEVGAPDIRCVEPSFTGLGRNRHAGVLPTRPCPESGKNSRIRPGPGLRDRACLSPFPQSAGRRPGRKGVIEKSLGKTTETPAPKSRGLAVSLCNNWGSRI